MIARNIEHTRVAHLALCLSKLPYEKIFAQIIPELQAKDLSFSWGFNDKHLKGSVIARLDDTGFVAINLPYNFFAIISL